MDARFLRLSGHFTHTAPHMCVWTASKGQLKILEHKRKTRRQPAHAHKNICSWTGFSLGTPSADSLLARRRLRRRLRCKCNYCTLKSLSSFLLAKGLDAGPSYFF